MASSALSNDAIEARPSDSKRAASESISEVRAIPADVEARSAGDSTVYARHAACSAAWTASRLASFEEQPSWGTPNVRAVSPIRTLFTTSTQGLRSMCTSHVPSEAHPAGQATTLWPLRKTITTRPSWGSPIIHRRGYAPPPRAGRRPPMTKEVTMNKLKTLFLVAL